MRSFAFAALLALPLLGIGAGGASADYYCCGQQKSYGHHQSGHYEHSNRYEHSSHNEHSNHYEHSSHYGHSNHYEHSQLYYVNKYTAVFDCDAYFCETKIKIERGATVKAHCREYGWCEITGGPFKNQWVVQSCLESHYGHDEGYGRGYEGGGEGDDSH